LKYALIGCGRIAINHVNAAISSSLEITALCDLEKQKAVKLRQEAGLEETVRIYQDYHVMLACEKPDLAAIAVESGNHAKIAMDCLRAGCHIIIEKPIALSLKDADEIIEYAGLVHKKVTVCHQNRFNTAVSRLRKAIEEEELGRITYGTAQIRWNRSESYYKQALWRGTWAMDGGALMNQCIHNIDLLLWMMESKPKRVLAMTDNLCHPYIQAEDLGLALVEFENGSYGMIEGTTDVYPENLEETLSIFGTQGTVILGGVSVNRIKEWRVNQEAEQEEVLEQWAQYPSNVYGFGHKLLYQDMIDSIKSDREPAITAQDGRNALELVLGIYESSHKKTAVYLPRCDLSTIAYDKGE